MGDRHSVATDRDRRVYTQSWSGPTPLPLFSPGRGEVGEDGGGARQGAMSSSLATLVEEIRMPLWDRRERRVDPEIQTPGPKVTGL